MKQAKLGDTVKVHYTVKLQDGSLVDTTDQQEPLTVEIGEKQVIEGFEEALIGMAISEKKSVVIPEDKAYGPYHEDWVVDIEKKLFPKEADMEIGEEIMIELEDGEEVAANIIEIGDTDIKVDMNFPLAGKALYFDLELIEII